MDQPQSGGSIPGSLQAKGGETEPNGAIRDGVIVGDFGRGYPGKPVGAVVAAAKVLRILHESERPLNASEVARTAGLHRGTAYNILRTLQARASLATTRRRAVIRSAFTFSNSPMAFCVAAG